MDCNNPKEHNLEINNVIEIIKNNWNPIYYCFSDEVGVNGTPHWHGFIIFPNPISFSSLKEKLNVAHIEKPIGTNQECKDYTFKEGKWLNDPKVKTNIRDSHVEYGELPQEEQGKRNDIAKVKELVEQGYSTQEIIDEYPHLSFQIDKIDNLISRYMQKKFSKVHRNVEVTYIFGKSRSGKTSYVYNSCDYNLFKVSNYDTWPFDGYEYEPTILFDEYHGQFSIGEILQYLDGYPLIFNVKNGRRQACFTKAFFTSNVPLEDLYINNCPNNETLNAFHNRISHVIDWYDEHTQFYYDSYEDYKNRLYSKEMHIKLEDLINGTKSNMER